MRVFSLGIILATAGVAAGCASAGSNRDVAAVVQNEQARQAVAQAAEHGESAKAALAGAADASDRAVDPPFRP